jgi:hypothetical protein
MTEWDVLISEFVDLVDLVGLAHQAADFISG